MNSVLELLLRKRGSGDSGSSEPTDAVLWEGEDGRLLWEDETDSVLWEDSAE